MSSVLRTLGLLLLTAPAAAASDDWGPWSASPGAPAMPTAADRERPPRSPADPAPSGIAAAPFLWMVTFYQKVISPVDGDRCPMYPTCSQYGVLALRKHGPVIGIIMTADRMMHESGEKAYVPLIRAGNRLRFYDPVENNDFWWHGP